MTFKPDYLCHPTCVAQAALAEQLEARKVDADEIEALRATNARLNRRCQTYESGVAEKVRESGGSLGRSLTRAAWAKCEAENEALRAVIAAFQAPNLGVHANNDGDFTIDFENAEDAKRAFDAMEAIERGETL